MAEYAHIVDPQTKTKTKVQNHDKLARAEQSKRSRLAAVIKQKSNRVVREKVQTLKRIQ